MLTVEQHEIIAFSCPDGRYADNTTRRVILEALAAAGGALPLQELALRCETTEIHVRTICDNWIQVIPTRVGPEKKHGYRLSVLLSERLGLEPCGLPDHFADIRPWLARATNISTVLEGLECDPRAVYVPGPAVEERAC